MKIRKFSSSLRKKYPSLKVDKLSILSLFEMIKGILEDTKKNKYMMELECLINKFVYFIYINISIY